MKIVYYIKLNKSRFE